MKCPRDGSELSKVELLNIELDKCHKCDGIWLDRGELESIRDSKVSDIEEAIERKYGNPECQPGETEGYMQCPRCEGRLQRFNYSYIASVYLDRCDTCLGIWLDDGELNAITSQKKDLDGMSDRSNLKAFLRSVGGFFSGKQS